MKPARRFLGLLAACALCVACLARAGTADAFFEANLGDFKAELQAAKGAGRQAVLLLFESDDCPYCQKMRREVLSRDDVQAYFRPRVASFSVDVRGAVAITDFQGQPLTEKALTRALHVRGTPTAILFDLAGREIARLEGAANVAEFMRFGRRAERVDRVERVDSGSRKKSKSNSEDSHK